MENIEFEFDGEDDYYAYDEPMGAIDEIGCPHCGEDCMADGSCIQCGRPIYVAGCKISRENPFPELCVQCKRGEIESEL